MNDGTAQPPYERIKASNYFYREENPSFFSSSACAWGQGGGDSENKGSLSPRAPPLCDSSALGGGGLPFSTLRHKHRYKPIPLASLCRAEGHWNFLEFLLFAITGAIQRNSLRRHKNYKNGLVYAEQGSDQNM